MIQNKLYNEMKDKEIFNLANDYGFEYLQNIITRNVYPEKSALEQLALFDEELPSGFTSSKEILNKLNNYGAPASVAVTGGRYFGFVVGGIVPAGLAAKLLAGYWDQNAAVQVLSPITSKLEIVVQKWLVKLFDLPASTVAGFVSGTSIATFTGLAAARYRLLKRKSWDINQQGLWGAPKIRIVAGNEVHSSVLKAIGLLGFGKDNVEWIATDDQGRIIPEVVPELDDNTILILQAGHLNTGAFDNFNLLCEKANSANSWVHIDGAFGLWAAAVDEFKHLTKGINKANSWSVDGHKTLNSPYDNGIVLCNDEEAIRSALHISGSYIIHGDERDGMFYSPDMSRRARSIELWATMKSLGSKGISEMVYGMHQRAVQFANGLRKAGFEILNDVSFNMIIVHYQDNETTRSILKEIQEQRVCWCGGAVWHGKDVIRISVCSWATTEDDVALSVESFVHARKKMELSN